MRKGEDSRLTAMVKHRSSGSRERWRLWIVLLLIVWGVPAFAESRSANPAQQPEARETPWLVTVIHRARVSDLVTTLRRRGLRVAALDGISPTQHITNVTSGIVIDPAGRILVRLATISPEARPEDVTVITADGRTFHPTRIGCDETSGYTVIEVPGLGIAPPPFAPLPTPTEALPVQIISQVPDLTEEHKALLSSLGLGRDDRFALPQPPTAPLKSASGSSPSLPGRAAPSQPSKLWSLRWKLDSARLAQRIVGDTAEKHPAVIVEVSDDEWSADGSVVLNDKNEVIGVAEEVSPRTYFLNPIATLRQLVEQLTRQMAKATTATAEKIKARLAQSTRSTTAAAANILTRFGGWLGIRATNLAETDEATRARLRNLPEKAVIITDVVAEGPAARAGVRTGDVLLSFNGQRLSSVDHLAELIATTPIGQEVTLDVWREGTRQAITTRIEDRPASFAGAPTERAEVPVSAPPRRPSERTISASGDHRPSSRITLTQLGLKVTDLTEQLATFFGVADRPGPLITEVTAGSPAARAGLRAGDIITAINGTHTPTRRDLLRVLRLIEWRDSTTLSVGLVRDRQPLVVSLRLSR
ncbi:MAG TPA: PDZ domain-containing protein [Blastocatellia bacterium]|nr:PDZ domain-containing protein [Blastocatellia bacterium]